MLCQHFIVGVFLYKQRCVFFDKFRSILIELLPYNCAIEKITLANVVNRQFVSYFMFFVLCIEVK